MSAQHVCIPVASEQTLPATPARRAPTASGIRRMKSRIDSIASRAQRPAEQPRRFVRGIERNKRRVLIGADAYAIDLAQRSFPTAYQGFLSRAARRQLQD